jgi:hypothetical protein
MALGAALISAADETVAVYAAAETLASGTRVDGDAVTVVRVKVDDVDRLYVPADEELPDDVTTVRTVGSGELLPRSALAGAGELAQRPVAVPLDGPVPTGLGTGARADVWISIAGRDRSAAGPPGQPPGQSAGQSEVTPEKVLVGVEVAAVDDGGGGLGTVGTASVSVLVDDGGVARILAALAAGHRVDVVPVPGSRPSDG